MMKPRLVGLAALAIIAIAVITAGIAYAVQLSSSDVPVHQESTHTSQPVKGQAPGIPAVSPEPVSSNTGFQTGDNDAPASTNAPRASTAPASSRPLPDTVTAPVSRASSPPVIATANPSASPTPSPSASPTASSSPVPTTLPPTPTPSTSEES